MVDIDKMSPGKEMDALVATEVMKWKLLPPEWIHGEMMHGMVEVETWEGSHKDNTFQTKESWKPSTSISHAWRVLELGHPAGWFDVYYLYRYGDGYALSRVHNPKNEIGTIAPTAQLAICRTALKTFKEAL